MLREIPSDHLRPDLGRRALEKWARSRRAAERRGDADRHLRHHRHPATVSDSSAKADGTLRLARWRRFGSTAFKADAPGLLELLGWDPTGAFLHVRSGGSLWVERWDVRTGERLPPTDLREGVDLAPGAACPFATTYDGDGVNTVVAELWNLRVGARVATLEGTGAFGPFAAPADGRFVVTGFPYVRVRALPGGEIVCSMEGQVPIAVSPDGSLLASRGSDRDYRSLRVARPNGTIVTVLEFARFDRPSALAFGPDGYRLVIGFCDGWVVCRDLAAQSHLWSARPFADPDDLPYDVRRFVFDDDPAPQPVFTVAAAPDGAGFFALDAGHRLCAISAEGEVRWRSSLRRGEPGPTAVVTAHWPLLPSPDGARLAVLVGGHLPRVFDAATGAELTPVEGHRGGVTALAFSPDGALLASGGDDGDVRVYDLAHDDTAWVLEADADGANGAEFTRDGRALRTTGRDGHVRRWSLATGSEEAYWKAGDSAVDAVGARDDARLLVVSAGRVELWSDETDTRVRWTRPIRRASRIEVAFSDGEELVLLASFGGPEDEEWEIATLDASTGRRRGARRVTPGRLIGLRPTDDGPLSISVAGERLAAREEFGARRELMAREASGEFWVVGASADGRLLALSDGGDVELWSLAPTARCVERVRAVEPFDRVTRLALSPDGALVAVGTACGVVTVYAREAVA